MSSSSKLSRRDFLRKGRSVVLSTGLGILAPNIFLNRTRAATGQNPSESIRVGFIGVGGQGNHNLGILMRNAVAVCDVDKSHLEKTKQRVEKANGRACEAFGDYRQLLEDKSIDAVLISTPDHWHTLIAIHACEAGKDVYCEKPLTLFIKEGQALVTAVRRHRRILQVGSQQRSSHEFLQACEYVRAGRLGKLKAVKVGLPGVNWEKKGNPGNVPDSEAPPELDYNMWLGPAPARRYNENRVHYLFRFFWDYSGGQMTNWGAHHLDITQWALGADDSGPVEIEGSATYNEQKLYETPQTFDANFKYGNGVTVQCSSGTGKFKGGVTFEGDRGTIHVTRGAIESNPKDILAEPLDDGRVKLYASTDHHQNWLECIKTRKDPICNVETGHRSATVCHLGNIAIRNKAKVIWDPKKEEMSGGDDLAKWCSRPYRTPWKLPER